VEVDLELVPVEPPAVLYHGTEDKHIASIMEKGLSKMNRNHVHMTDNLETAYKVGKRHGSKVVILEIDCLRMTIDGYVFYQSDNGVWLTSMVPSKYLRIME
jgi:putative RNA 2'-phosphotransferase